MRCPCQEGPVAIKEGFLPELRGVFIFKLVVRLALPFAKLPNNWASYAFAASRWEEVQNSKPSSSGEQGRALLEHPLASVSQPHFKGILLTHLWSYGSCDLEEALGPLSPRAGGREAGQPGGCPAGQWGALTKCSHLLVERPYQSFIHRHKV